jgi:hypothetical protein
MSSSFKADPGVREYGFTDEQGNAVTRRPNEDGIITARDAFEERHFRTIGLAETEPPKAKRKSSRKAATKKSSAKTSSAKAAPAAPAAKPAETTAPIETSSTKAATPAATVEG